MATIESMAHLANQAKSKAYSPYSKFNVGACILTQSGETFTGCNVENASYSLTICAEANAIGSMMLNNKHKIAELVVVSSGDMLCPPCGACRQMIREFSLPDSKVHMVGNNGEIKTMTVEEMLPDSFGPNNLED